MLSNITLVNFLSYANESVDLSGDSATIAVVGDNGQGKSSVLEAISFALYGVSRYKTINQLVRIGSSGDMNVSVKLQDLPTAGETLTVMRGYNLKKEAGYMRVYVGEDLKAKGGAAPKNNPAQTYLDKVLGVDATTFMLTSFFGLGGNDAIMKVGPAEKLETLQRLAGAALCVKINEAASKEQKSYADKLKLEERALEVLQGAVKDVVALEAELSEQRAGLEDATRKLRAATVDKESLVAWYEERRALGVTVSTLSGNRKLLEQSVKKIEDGQVRAQEKRQRYLSDRETTVRELADVQNFLKQKDKDALKKKDADLCRELADARAEWKLLDVSTGVGSVGTCPLCKQEVPATIQAEWLQRKSELLKTIDRAGSELEQTSEALTEIARETVTAQNLEKRLAVLDNSLSEFQGSNDEQREELVELVRQREALDTEIKGTAAQLESLPDCSDQLRKAVKAVGDHTSTVAALRADIAHSQKDIEDAKKAQDRITGMQANIVSLGKKVRAAALVAEAFSRYAIPLEMLKRLRQDIESRASAIYREFTEGNIVVRDTEGARPGIDFVLVDGTGERSFEGLSEGEKVMFSLAVRVAITQRESKLRDSKVDFLVLDEVAGSLSPAKRESLTMVIQKILKRYFKQIFMVSHVALREIFTKTLEVAKVDGVSRVEVL